MCIKKKSHHNRGNIWPNRRWYASTRRRGGSGVQMRLEQVLPLPFCPGSFPAPSLLRKPQSKQRSGASIQSLLQSLPPTPRGASADELSEPGRIPLIENHKGIRFLHPAYTVMHEKHPMFGCRVDSNGGQNGADRVPTKPGRGKSPQRPAKQDRFGHFSLRNTRQKKLFVHNHFIIASNLLI